EIGRHRPVKNAFRRDLDIDIAGLSAHAVLIGRSGDGEHAAVVGRIGIVGLVALGVLRPDRLVADLIVGAGTVGRIAGQGAGRRIAGRLRGVGDAVLGVGVDLGQVVAGIVQILDIIALGIGDLAQAAQRALDIGRHPAQFVLIGIDEGAAIVDMGGQDYPVV